MSIYKCIVIIVASGVAITACSKTVKTPLSVQDEAVVRVEARADGFYPSALTLPPGEAVPVDFIRTAGNTCASAVEFGASGDRYELPLNEPVRIHVHVRPGESVSFACPMNMYTGTILAAGDTERDELSEVAYWSCSMHPSVKSSVPGTCPICSMDLTPVTRHEVESGVIQVDAARRQLIGVTVDTAGPRMLSDAVRAAGMVMPDETRIHEVTLRTNAWIEEVRADYTGKLVKKGELLLTYFSPDLLQRQSDYLVSVSETARRAGLEAGERERLRVWGMETEQIDELAARGEAFEYIRVTSPITGTVIEKHVVAGSAVEMGEPLYRIADLSVVWIEADVYEEDIGRLAVGQRAQIAVQGLPGHEFEGTVTYVYPYLNGETRTGRVRFEVPNPDGLLKPDMYADVTALVSLGERLVVPEGAVIYAGQTNVLFVDLGEGRLEPRRVKTGVRTAGYVEILEGVTAGEVVVTSANFLIAAESKLKSGIEKW